MIVNMRNNEKRINGYKLDDRTFEIAMKVLMAYEDKYHETGYAHHQHISFIEEDVLGIGVEREEDILDIDSMDVDSEEMENYIDTLYETYGDPDGEVHNFKANFEGEIYWSQYQYDLISSLKYDIKYYTGRAKEIHGEEYAKEFEDRMMKQIKKITNNTFEIADNIRQTVINQFVEEMREELGMKEEI